MLFYILLSFVCLLPGILFPSYKNSSHQKRQYLFLNCILLTVVMGLRGRTVGIDTAVSNDFYIRIAQENDFSVYMNIVNAAPVYSLYNKGLSLLSSNPYFLNIANAFIINVCFMYFIYQYSDNVIFSVYCYMTMYFYFFSFNGTRQMLACAICLLAFVLYQKRHFFRAIITFICAIGIHTTCIVFLPVFLLSYPQYKTCVYKMFFLLIIAGGAIFQVASKVIFFLVFHFLPAYQKYEVWLNAGRFQAQGRNVLVTIFYTIFVLMFLVIVWKYKVKKNYIVRRDWILLLPAMCGLVLGILFYKNALISGRVILYFTAFMTVVLPNFIEKFYNGKILLYLSIGACLLFLLYYQLNINYAGIIPYHFL